MAARCQATSSTPVSLIYSQSWPVPSHRSFEKRYPENPASNNHKKSINSPWISQVKKHKTTTLRVSSPAVNVRKLHSWTSSMLNNQYPEWIEDTHTELDMAKEFKLTLQMFKKLTQQVKEVDEQLNSRKQSCTFKHYFTSKDGPGIYRSQLAANMRSFSSEIPMTNQPYQPCDNFGYKKELRRPHTHLGIYRTNDNKITRKSKPKADKLPISNPTCGTNSNVCKTEQEKHLKKQRYQYPLTYKADSLETRNRQFSSSEYNDEANEEFGYIDPMPVDWDKIKLEEIDQAICSDKNDKVDPFIARYLQLRRLEADTLENERYNPRSEESVENLCNLNSDSHRTNGHSQKKKICGNGKHSSKTSVEKIKMGEKSSKRSVNISKKSIKSNSPYLHCVSASGFKSDPEITSKYRKSCFSQYGEGNLKKEKQTGTSLRKKQNKTTSCSTKRGKCSSAKTGRKISDGRMVCSRSSYQSCSVAVYDIVQLASSFDPPCKERMSRPASAKSKGLLPGKSWNSQRRFSLTSDQTFRPMANETCVPLVDKSSSSKGRQKSAKKTTRRCSSSKL